jgi:hypothetical protein
MNLADDWVAYNNVTGFGTASQQVAIAEERIDFCFIRASVLYPKFWHSSIGFKC